MKTINFTLLFTFLCTFSFSQTPYMAVFDGVNDYIKMGDVNDLGTSDFTIEAWVYMDANGGKIVNKGLTSVGTPTNAGYGLRLGVISPGLLDFSFSGGGTVYRLTENGLSTSQWYHIAATRKDNTYALYVDCELVDDTTLTTTLDLNTDMPLSIGAIDKGGLSTTSEFFDGNIDEVRIWEHANDSAWICYLKDCAINVAAPYLLASYNLDHSSGTVATDDSGHGNDGTCLNGVSWASSSVADSICFCHDYDPASPGTRSTSSVEESLDNVNSELDKVSVYPNPTKSILNFKNLNQEVQYIIYDMSGKKVMEGNIRDEKNINIEPLTKGMYTIRLRNDQDTNALKFVID